MAFDGAAPTMGGGGSGTGVGSDVLQWLGQRVYTLFQTVTTLTTLSVALGGSGDTFILRQRLGNAETTGQRLMDEIEKQVLKSRLEFMSKGVDHANSRALRRLEDQYSEVKLKFQEARTASLLKRRQYEPRAEGATGVPEKRGGVGKGPGGVGSSEVVFQSYSEVDAAIAEEKRAEALAIARESAALTSTMRDLSGLIGEQEESVAVVEKHVDGALKSTEAGVADLEKAQEYVRSCRWKGLFAVFLVLALVGTLLGLHFGPTRYI